VNWERDVPDGELRLVRPYTITGGRTRPTGEFIALEALVTVSAGGSDSSLRHELSRVVTICSEPRSLAEIAARIALPVGVVRVLVGDLVATGHVQVVNGQSSRPNAALLHRVLARLEAL